MDIASNAMIIRANLLKKKLNLNMIKLHKKYIAWFKEKFNMSDYGLLWLTFIKGLIIGLLIYHFCLF